MSYRLAVLMDPIASINIKKDSSFALLLEAQRRNYELFYLELSDIFLRDGKSYGRLRPIRVQDEPSAWFSLQEPQERRLSEMDLILMRKDPPYDTEYLHATHILDFAEPALVVNAPRALRDANEKIFAQQFPEFCPPTLVTRDRTALRAFVREHGDAVLKPLDAMGGASVFRVTTQDPNLSVILELMTGFDRRAVMAQRYIPEVVHGDKRILLFDGEAAPYALARVPQQGETRANMAAGGIAKGVELTVRDLEICRRIGPELSARGLWLVGIDVIGEYLTEINVTSPTGIRELDKFFHVNLAGTFFDAMELRLTAR